VKTVQGNLVTRLPETVIIAALATGCGYLIHEASTNAMLVAQMKSQEMRISALEDKVEEQRRDFREMHPPTR